ncbi:MAG: energy-coupling factor transporter transmembrane protein EcfT [Eubacterium sp.]|nr:energy-coupling factor transporter transmembrane protein EcfT [Eubacterium sp.]
MIDEFGRFHPVSNLIFFLAVIAFSTFWMQAGMIAVSFICATVYYFMLKKSEGINYFIVVLISVLIASLINPLFSHRGKTTLFYLPTGNPVTLESIIFGLCAGVILGEVLLWFSIFNNIMEDDKWTATIGKVAPTISMIITMVLRFVPKYIRFSKNTRNIQRANGFSGGKKIKNGMHIYSITATWALETSIDTADSMKARGYGKAKRTHYHNYKFEIRDLIFVLWVVLLGAVILCMARFDKIHTFFYPTLRSKESIIVLVLYIVLCMTPVLINIWEKAKWHILKSKI